MYTKCIHLEFSDEFFALLNLFWFRFALETVGILATAIR